MRILLDESLPIELRDELPQHSIRSVQEMGWSALKNGELLRRAVHHFDVFVTADQNLQYQQNIKNLPIAVAVLGAQCVLVPVHVPSVAWAVAAWWVCLLRQTLLVQRSVSRHAYHTGSRGNDEEHLGQCQRHARLAHLQRLSS